ncbi:MAG TPA: hypothetical protein VGK33_14105 [Chloroflexota bacterium]|jgi:hypothetical protein
MRGAAGAFVGGAAIGVARLATKGHSRPKMLGITIPDELNPQRLDASKLAKSFDARKLVSHIDIKGLGKNVNLKDVIRQIGDVAEQVEARSEDVQALSRQAKRLSRRMS